MKSRGRCSILVADDEEGMRLGLEKALSLEGYRVVTAATGREAREALSRERLSCAFVDLKLPDMRGIDLLPDFRSRATPVVIITAYATIDTAVTAMKLGACDYIQKPFDNRDLVEMADRLCLSRSLDSPPAGRERGSGGAPRAKASGRDTDAPDGAHDAAETELIAESEAMQEILATLRKVKDTEIPVLLQGESGTGKEMLARFVHTQSVRSGRPFVAINCAAIPRELLESELFGHERGSFTGAHASQIGKFEAAGEGTIFLDEISEMSPQLQTKLLRALEERCFEPIGSTRSLSLQARVIASTNSDLQRLIREKQFRIDLYYRLKGISITIPPLRERCDDIAPLLAFFLDRYRTRYQKPEVTIAHEALRALRGYAWPGNVRELKNAVESAVLLCDEQRPLLTQDFLLDHPAEALPELWRRERDWIIEVLQRNTFNRSSAARELGMSRKTLYNKMKKYGIG